MNEKSSREWGDCWGSGKLGTQQGLGGESGVGQKAGREKVCCDSSLALPKEGLPPALILGSQGTGQQALRDTGP